MIVTCYGGVGEVTGAMHLLSTGKATILTVKQAAVVHGEEEQSEQFADHLRSQGFAAMVPRRGEAIKLHE